LEPLIKIIQELNISDNEKALIFQQIKAIEKTIAIAEFKYNRTVLDKAAIKNVLNASIQEIEKQKKDIEAANNEIRQNLIELDAQKKIIEEKNSELNKAITKLKSTQSQLIHSEKMASLGELTAGIAHEIQNPLNFVNNFSEVSKELIVEMNEDLAIGNIQLAKEIAGDIEQNLEKINHHGKRAADIVKGMLQHSRTSSGQKEPTDINALCDEYLRLAYHGLKAKDKSFNADFKSKFDPNLPKINIIPQDIGRVLLNLINNAFYAVSERSKKGEEAYKPTVLVSTAKVGDKLEIKVADNGNGIPENIKGKIFQPFFTTKPTGSGTGLGLSLSYDIVKAHGGELKVDSEEGVGTVFNIVLKLKD
jgi:two-component system, NtrC family, sensor kinase